MAFQALKRWAFGLKIWQEAAAEPNGVEQEGEKVEKSEKAEEGQEEAWNARATAIKTLVIEAV